MPELGNLSLAKLGAARRRTVDLDRESLVRTRSINPDGELPLLVEPAVEGLDLASWAAEHRDWVEEQLDRCSGILFRGFGLRGVEQFEGVIRALYGEMLEYTDRVQPRTQIGRGTYSSTEYPPDQSIELHNESSYAFSWPLRIFFYCEHPSEVGGETPIADCRRLLRAIDPEVRRRFSDRRVTYVRNFGDGFGIPWQTAFQTEDRAEMEEFCRRNGVDFEWKDGDRLRTRSVRPVSVRHPRTGDEVWFNAAVSSHISTVEPSVRALLEAEFAPDELPKNSFYGDGSAIEDEVLDELRRAYREVTFTFTWQAGDVLLLDNMLAAHGRAPYRGHRKVVVGMARPVRLDEIDN